MVKKWGPNWGVISGLILYAERPVSDLMGREVGSGCIFMGYVPFFVRDLFVNNYAGCCFFESHPFWDVYFELSSKKGNVEEMHGK